MRRKCRSQFRAEMAWLVSFVSAVTVGLLTSAIVVDGQAVYHVSYEILEELSSGTVIGHVIQDANLADEFPEEALDELEFNILPPDHNDVVYGDYFSIGEDSGILEISRVIDRDDETLCAYQDVCHMTFAITVGPALYFRMINIQVTVLDINDNSPVFSQNQYNLNISEAVDLVSTTHTLPSVYDRDSANFGIRRFEIHPDTGQFDINWSRDLQGRIQPRLELRQALDREEIQAFDLSVVAYDSGNPPNSAELLVHVIVQDTNDNSPEFGYPTYETRIPEDTAIGTSLLTVHADDPDEGSGGQVRYTIRNPTLGEDVRKFRIDPMTGTVYLQQEVDRELQDVYYLSVVARDQGRDGRQSTASVTVYVDDVNDNAPVIRVNVITSSGEAEILESADVGTFVALVSVTDRDWGQNADITCRLNSEKFTMLEMPTRNKFKIVTDTDLDRESQAHFRLAVTCEDSGEPIRSSLEQVEVYVTDVNDHAPVFTEEVYQARLPENAALQSEVLTVTAEDRDSGLNSRIVYSLITDFDGAFLINPDTGVIITNSRYDYEDVQQIRLRVEARDRGTPVMTSSCEVMISVSDVNDESPIFDSPAYTFVVQENAMSDVTVGRVHAFDADTAPYDALWYSLQETTSHALDYVTVDPTSGVISLRQPLDREIHPLYYLTVVATNREPPRLTGTASVTIYVDDVNDNAPIVDFPSPSNRSVQVSSRLPPGYKVTQIEARDLDTGSNAELNYFLFQNDEGQEQTFGVDPKSGEIFLNRDLSGVNTDTYNISVLIKDGGHPQLSARANLSITVNQSLTVSLIGGNLPTSYPASGGGNNMLIIIIVVAVSGVVIILLLGSIVFVLLTSRRKASQQQASLVPPSIVLDNVDAESADGNPVPEGGRTEVDKFGRMSPINDVITGSEAVNKGYVTLSNKMPSLTRESHVNSAPPVPPRGVFVTYNAGNPDVNITFGSEDSEHRKPELRVANQGQRSSGARSGATPVEIDRESASSGEHDSTTDSGMGASDEGFPQQLHRDNHGNPRQKQPTSQRNHVTPTPEVVLTPEYGLSHMQTQFDPHYQLKYSTDSASPRDVTHNSYNSPSPDFSYPLIGQDTSYQSNGPYTRQTVRDVKAKDKNKRTDHVSSAMNNSSLFKRYQTRPDEGEGAPCNFSDANSLFNYKMNDLHRSTSEMTDATSETSATSGSYVIQHDDDANTLPDVLMNKNMLYSTAVP